MMGAAAYNRGSRAIRTQLDHEAADRRVVHVQCTGKLYNGPGKRFTRCAACHAVDYESNEGDRCRAMVAKVRR